MGMLRVGMIEATGGGHMVLARPSFVLPTRRLSSGLTGHVTVHRGN